jgi:hypothetical protein
MCYEWYCIDGINWFVANNSYYYVLLKNKNSLAAAARCRIFSKKLKKFRKSGSNLMEPSTLVVRSLTAADLCSGRWEPAIDASYHPIDVSNTAAAIKSILEQAADGSLFPVRGRDSLEIPMVHAPLQYGPWEYGIAVKWHRRIFMLWPEAVESCLIDGLDLINQVRSVVNIIIFQPWLHATPPSFY